MRLCHNMYSMQIYNTYKKSESANEISMKKVSTGTKINSAKDNPTKLCQSENMRLQIRSLEQASKNVQDTTSMLQSVDGDLQAMNEALNRMQELAVQAGSASTANDPDALASIQKEMNQMIELIDDRASYSEFNGVKLIDNKEVVNNDIPEFITVMNGSMAGENTRIPMYRLTSDMLVDDDGNVLKDCDISTKEGRGKAISVIQSSTEKVSRIRSKYGALSSRFESTSEDLNKTANAVQNAESSIRDTDIAAEALEFNRTQILMNSGIALMCQSNKIPMDAMNTLSNSFK